MLSAQPNRDAPSVAKIVGSPGAQTCTSELPALPARGQDVPVIQVVEAELAAVREDMFQDEDGVWHSHGYVLKDLAGNTVGIGKRRSAGLFDPCQPLDQNG